MCTTHLRVLSCHYCLPLKRFVALMRKTNMCMSCKWPGTVLFAFQPLWAPYLLFTTVYTKPWSSNRDQGSVERARQRSRGICRVTDMSVQFIEPNLTLCKINCVSPACHFVLPSETFSRKNCNPCLLGWQLSSNIHIEKEICCWLALSDWQTQHRCSVLSILSL